MRCACCMKALNLWFTAASLLVGRMHNLQLGRREWEWGLAGEGCCSLFPHIDDMLFVDLLVGRGIVCCRGILAMCLPLCMLLHSESFAPLMPAPGVYV